MGTHRRKKISCKPNESSLVVTGSGFTLASRIVVAVFALIMVYVFIVSYSTLF